MTREKTYIKVSIQKLILVNLTELVHVLNSSVAIQTSNIINSIENQVKHKTLYTKINLGKSDRISTSIKLICCHLTSNTFETFNPNEFFVILLSTN